MKLDSIMPPELALLESLQRGTDPLTHKNLQVMHENFVVPYSRWLKSQYTLLEAEMTADQITQAFGSAEKIATAGGDNRSMLGKGADVVGAGAKGAADLAVKGAKGTKDLAAKLVPQAVKDKFTKSLPPADAGPVAGFEQKATQAIAGIQDPKAKQSLMDKIKIGLQNPATQQLIMVGVSGIAGVIAGTATAGIGGYAGAAAAGAITGSLLGAINAKMQGKSWGDTGKAALKGAALGAAGGLIGKGVTDAAGAAANAFQNRNDPTGPVGAPGAQDDVTGVDDAVAKNAQQTENPQAKADAQTAYNKIYPNENPAGAGGEAPINSNAGQQQVDLNAMVQNKIDTGAIPTPQGPQSYQGQSQTDTTDVGTAAGSAPTAAPAAGFKEVTPQGDVVGQLKDLVGQGYQVQRSQTDPGSIAVFDKDGNPMQTLKVGGFSASRMSAAANGILLRSGHSPVPAINENVDYELTARMWALRNRVGKPYGKIHMTEAAIQRAFVLAATGQLNEGPMDWIKKKAGQAADFVKTKVGNVTNKITADKLQQAWTKAGSPTDSVEVGKIMAANGVPQDSVDQILKNMGVPNAPAVPAQAGADAGTPETPPTQAPTPEAPPAQAGGATPPAQAQTGGTSTPPTNKEIAQGAIAKAQDSSKGGSSPTNVTGTIQKGAEELQGITGAIKAGQGMGTSGTSLMQPRDGSNTAGEVKIKDEKGQEHAYKKVGQKWYGKDNKEVPPAIAAMLDKQAVQQAALAQGKKAAPLTGPQGEIPGAKPPAPAKAEPISVGGQKLDPKDPASAKIIAQVQQAQGGAQQAGATSPNLGTQSDGKPIKPGQKFDTETGKPLAQQPGTALPATAQQEPAALDPRDLNKDGTVDATEKSIARNQAKTGTKPPAATTAPAGQSPEDIRKAKQADAAKAAQAQMTAKPAQAVTPPATEPATTAEPVPGETPAQTAAKTRTGGKVAGQLSQTPNAIRKRDARAVAAQAKTTGNDVMGRMAKQLGTAPAGGPAQAEPTATPTATPDFSKTMTGYGKTTTNAPTGVPSVAKPTVPAATNATTEPAAVAPKAKRSVTGDVPVPDNFGKQPEMAGIDFSAVLLRKMKQIV
jgi:hypothetical protein